MNLLRGNIRYSDVRGYLGHYSHSQRRNVRKTVEENFAFPSSLNGVHSSSVWGIAMVRDEEDIIEAVIRHQLRQGISPILIADNNSADDTLSILAQLAKELPIYVVTDALRAYHQAEKMTALARMAFRQGATWIVPFDADEMWFAADMTVADFLSQSDLSIVNAAMHNVYPGIQGSPEKFELTKQPMGKVAFRASHFALLGIGNHTVTRSGKAGQGLYLAHYPWRSMAQLQRKTRQGRQALEEASLPINMGSHWRALANLADDEVADLWSFVETQTPHPALNDRFLGPFQEDDPTTWYSWEGPRFEDKAARSRHG